LFPATRLSAQIPVAATSLDWPLQQCDNWLWGTIQMDLHNQCAECEQMVMESRAAFAKLMSTRPQGELPTREQFLRLLEKAFASNEILNRLSEEWHQSEAAETYHRWTEHRIATGHMPVLRSATGQWGLWRNS
jgi:hypothetical protein